MLNGRSGPSAFLLQRLTEARRFSEHRCPSPPHHQQVFFFRPFKTWQENVPEASQQGPGAAFASPQPSLALSGQDLGVEGLVGFGFSFFTVRLEGFVS